MGLGGYVFPAGDAFHLGLSISSKSVCNCPTKDLKRKSDRIGSGIYLTKCSR